VKVDDLRATAGKVGEARASSVQVTESEPVGSERITGGYSTPLTGRAFKPALESLAREAEEARLLGIRIKGSVEDREAQETPLQSVFPSDAGSSIGLQIDGKVRPARRQPRRRRLRQGRTVGRRKLERQPRSQRLR